MLVTRLILRHGQQKLSKQQPQQQRLRSTAARLCGYHRPVINANNDPCLPFTSLNNRQTILRSVEPHGFSQRSFFTTLSIDDTNDFQRYLCRASYPLGSFDSSVVEDIAKVIDQTAKKATPQALQSAFDLLNRLVEEAAFEKDSAASMEEKVFSDRVIPYDLLHNFVEAWKQCWKEHSDTADTTIALTPRLLFETVQACKSSLPGLHHDAVPCNMIINVAADLQDPVLAEEILNYLLDCRVFEDNLQTSVGVTSFSSVIAAWAKSGRYDAPQRAESVFRKMMEYSQAGWEEATPDTVAYSSVITAWANSLAETAPHRAEELLREMQARGLDQDSYSYSSVLTAWARSKEPQAPDRAFAILKHMVDLHKQGIANVKPNAHCFSSVISAYANRGNVQRAEQVLMELCELYQSTKDRDLLPNKIIFSAVINAWSKSGKPIAPRMAEALLEQMQDLATEWGEPSLLPDAVSFTTVMNAWSHSKDRDAPLRCEKILKNMQELHEQQGREDCRPNALSFATAVYSWSRSNKREAAERAEALVHHMYSLYKAGDEAAKPDVFVYSAAMTAWATSGHPDAGVRAQALFDELTKQFEAGDRDMKPNDRSYASLIRAWGRSRRKDSASKAQAVFDDMMSRYQSGEKDLEPDSYVYTALIDAWSYAGSPEKAEEILRTLNSNKTIAAESKMIAYSSVMNVWSKSNRPDAIQRTAALFDELVQHYLAGDRKLKPGLFSYATMIQAWGRSKQKDGALKAQEVFDKLLSRYRSGDKELKPDIVVYTTLIDAWSRAGHPERAELILREIGSNESLGVRLNTFPYVSVMKGWSCSKHPMAAERIHALYDDMNAKYFAGNNPEVKPDARILELVISAWLRKGRNVGLSKLEAVYKDIQDRYQDGEAEMKPFLEELGRVL